MTLILANYPLPEQGPVHVHLSFEIVVTAKEAWRKVTRWLVMDVSIQMGTDPPTLVVGERSVWRFPVYIAFPGSGRVGTVGEVDVDAGTGELLDAPRRQTEMTHRAKKLAENLPPFKVMEVSPEYLSSWRVPTIKLLDDDSGEAEE